MESNPSSSAAAICSAASGGGPLEGQYPMMRPSFTASPGHLDVGGAVGVGARRAVALLLVLVVLAVLGVLAVPDGLGGLVQGRLGARQVAEAGQAREHLAQLGELAGDGVALAGQLGDLALGGLLGDLGVGLGLEHELLGLGLGVGDGPLGERLGLLDDLVGLGLALLAALLGGPLDLLGPLVGRLGPGLGLGHELLGRGDGGLVALALLALGPLTALGQLELQRLQLGLALLLGLAEQLGG